MQKRFKFVLIIKKSVKGFEEARVRYFEKNYLKKLFTFHFLVVGDIFLWYAYRIYILY